jgi:uncharacterized SAM-binding protein YcdF (DUF218 family)
VSAVLSLPIHAQPARWRRFALFASGAVLMGDAVWLMGKGLFNLGVLLPFVIGLSFVVVAWRWLPLETRLQRSALLRGIWRWGWVAFGVWLLSLAIFWTALWHASQGAAGVQVAPQALVVLGSGSPGEEPSPVLKARLDLTLTQATRYPNARVVVSGGTDFLASRAEAQIMGDYLRQHGLPASRIVQEERSTSTHENLIFSAALLRKLGIQADAPVRVITSDFHTLRTRWIAQRAGYAAIETAGAPTPLYVRYNAWLREYFAFVSGWLLDEY